MEQTEWTTVRLFLPQQHLYAEKEKERERKCLGCWKCFCGVDFAKWTVHMYLVKSPMGIVKSTSRPPSPPQNKHHRKWSSNYCKENVWRKKKRFTTKIWMNEEMQAKIVWQMARRTVIENFQSHFFWSEIIIHEFSSWLLSNNLWTCEMFVIKSRTFDREHWA